MVTTGNDPQVAKRIAELINSHNKLTKTYTAQDIILSRSRYYPIVFAKHVLASVGLDRLNFCLTEVKHLVVAPTLRGLGLARNLLSRIALPKVETPFVVASVRADNFPSLQLFSSAGFQVLGEPEYGGHKLKLMGRLTKIEEGNSS